MDATARDRCGRINPCPCSLLALRDSRVAYFVVVESSRVAGDTVVARLFLHFGLSIDANCSILQASVLSASISTFLLSTEYEHGRTASTQQQTTHKVHTMHMRYAQKTKLLVEKVKGQKGFLWAGRLARAQARAGGGSSAVGEVKPVARE